MIDKFLFTLRASLLLLSMGTLFACSSEVEEVVEEEVEDTNAAPTVDAGEDQNVDEGDTVTLTASITDDSTYSVAWTQDSGTAVSLSDTSAETTSFTAPDISENETLTFTVTVDDGVNAAVSDSVSIDVTAQVEDDGGSDEGSGGVNTSVWIVNDTGEQSEHILDSTTGVGVEVNVQSVEEETVNGVEYVVVTSQGIPKYDVTITQDIYDGLAGRPKADSDFASGKPIVEVGDVVKYGQDVGYLSNTNCTTDYGFGYWPPGPECPTQDQRVAYIPVEPTPAEGEVCENGLSKVGIMVNGTSIYNWEDGFTYNQEGAWSNLAPEAEVYDVDICGGHAAGTDYHHHFYSQCLADLLGDDGTSHSPLYGYAADGYPIYGPWEADGVLAKSAWVTRDYDDATVGCSDGARSCTLIDQYDPSLGTEEVTQGPSFEEEVTSLSQNVFIAENGFYQEDYYWDSSLTALGGEYLDQYNAHEDSERGYHYHITIAFDENGDLVPAFPYIIGPRYAGVPDELALGSCDSGMAGPPPRN